MYIVTVQFYGPTARSASYEFKGGSGLAAARACYDSYLQQSRTDSTIVSIEWWQQDARAGIDQEIQRWDR